MDIRTGIAKSGELDIAYEDMGDVNDPAVLLIMGLGAQLVYWRKGFCERLVNQGLRVIRFDNRDIGLSSKLEGRDTGAKLLPRLLRFQVGLRNAAGYTLEDMADDAAALLDHLQIEKAHVVGGSMGGMIAQIFAATHQHRTKTLGLIFTSNNRALLPLPALKQMRAATTRSKDTSRDGVIANAVRTAKIIGSPGYPASEDQMVADATESYDRSYDPDGEARQYSAMLGSGSLLRYDKQITAPTVVIHGQADKMMRPTCGRAVAKAIRGSRWVTFAGMAHDIPEPLWDDILGELKTNFSKVP
ncbi:alpha/beta fold hydrolase [Streptomyces sp. NBC_00076]|uniref:alpha/beta fold hydrolase n=1 Tax=Streptomyces sp. NBC_00076 TaxID=2975642 RepID=UPI00324E97E4